MNYDQAEQYRTKHAHLAPSHFNLWTNIGPKRTEVMPLVISPINEIGWVIYELCRNGADNKKALIDMEIINCELRVFAVAYVNYPELVFEDLQNFVDDDYRTRMN